MTGRDADRFITFDQSIKLPNNNSGLSLLELCQRSGLAWRARCSLPSWLASLSASEGLEVCVRWCAFFLSQRMACSCTWSGLSKGQNGLHATMSLQEHNLIHRSESQRRR